MGDDMGQGRGNDEMSVIEAAAKLRIERLRSMVAARTSNNTSRRETHILFEQLTPHHTETWRSLLVGAEGACSEWAEKHFVAAASGLGQTAHTLLLTKTGEVWSFGADGSDGRLGHGDSSGRLVPHRVAGLARMQLVACGGMARSALVPDGVDPGGSLKGGAAVGFTPRGEHFAVKHAAFSAALSADGQVYTWGDNVHGCLGHGHMLPIFAPTRVSSLGATCITALALGGAHCLAVTDRGGALAWGLGANGQLGLGSRRRHALPQEVSALCCETVVRVAAAGSFSAFVSAEGALYMCGCGWDGQLGTGDREGRGQPTRVGSWGVARDEHSEENEEEDSVVEVALGSADVLASTNA